MVVSVSTVRGAVLQHVPAADRAQGGRVQHGHGGSPGGLRQPRGARPRNAHPVQGQQPAPGRLRLHRAQLVPWVGGGGDLGLNLKEEEKIENRDDC